MMWLLRFVLFCSVAFLLVEGAGFNTANVALGIAIAALAEGGNDG